MPLTVRLKVIAIVFLAVLICLCLALLNLWFAAAFFLVSILYVEMIYPKWNFFGSAILNVRDRGPNAVAITFDDGPSVWTIPILDCLKAEQVKATFFLLGANVARHPEIARRIRTEGHAIGIHGETHTKFHLKSLSFIREDLDACDESFKKAGITHDALIRFPHGFKNIFAVREAKRRGLRLCSWGKGVWDSQLPGTDIIVKRSLSLRPGEILLLHDGNGAHENPNREQVAQALPEIIRGLKAKNYKFVPLVF